MRNFEYQIIALFSAFIALTTSAQAHPTSFKDAFTLDTMNSSDENSAEFHYSLNPRLALGAHGMRENHKGSENYSVTSYTGILLHRVNDFAYQANIYAFGGLGMARYRSNQQLAVMSGVQADIEDRRWLLMGKFTAMNFRKFEDFYTTTGRIGFAPYEAGYEEINSWFIGQYDFEPHERMNHDFSGFLRLFYRNVMVEMGSSFRGEWKLNLMFHH